MRFFRLFVMATILVMAAPSLFAVNFVVNDAGDQTDGDSTDGVCDTGTAITPTGKCTLRAAIQEATNEAGVGAPYNITFSGVTSITIGSFMDIRQKVVIDGGPTKVTIDGNNAANGAFTLSFNSGGSTIKNLIIIKMNNDAISIGTDGNNILGNFIGTSDGTTAAGNNGNGILISSAGNKIGGPNPAEFNVISANQGWGVFITSVTATGNLVSTNFIGTDILGQNALGNSEGGVFVGATSNAVATNPLLANAIAANVISGNGRGITGSAGITMQSAVGTLITANYIGVSFPLGTAAIPNDGDGIYMNSSTANIIGGLIPTDANIISGNNEDGIQLTSGSDSNLINGNFIGYNKAGSGTLGNVRDGIFLNANNNIISGILVTAPQLIGNNGRNGITVQGATGNQIISNQISNNTRDGVQVTGGTATGNEISKNEFSTNGTLANDLAIDLVGTDGPDLGENTDPLDADTGPNNLQNRPSLTSAVINGGTTTVTGTVQSLPGTTFTIEFFTGNPGTCDTSGFGEGATYDSQTTVGPTDASGNATFSIPLSQSGLALGTIVTATLTDPANNTSEFSNCAAVTAPSADMSVTKTDSPDPVAAGTDLTYTITVTNGGPSPADNVSLTDPLPAGTTFVSMPTPGGWSCTTPAVGATGVVTCNIATLAVGSVPFTLTVHVAPATPAFTLLSNTAIVASTTADPVPGNEQSTATTTVTSQADLGVTKTDSPDPVIAGNNITYTVTVTNAGPSDAANPTLTDLLDANTTFVSLVKPAAYSCTTPAVGSTGSINCNATTQVAGPGAVFTIVVKVPANIADGTVVQNNANVGTTSTDTNDLNNVASQSTTVNAQADMSITKSDSPDPVAPGANITYTITVTNNGPSDAQGLTFTDTTPANTTFVNLVSGGGYSCSTPIVGGTGLISCTNPTVAAGSPADTFTLVVAVDAATPNATVITNTANIATTTTDPTAPNNSATTTTTVQVAALSADLGVTKTDSPDPVTAGSNLTYTINVTNGGPDPASTVSLTDTLPAGTTFVSLTNPAAYTCTTPAVGANGTVTCTNPSVPNAANDAFTLVVKVDSATGAGATISNTVNVTTATGDPNPANDSATSTTTVATSADVALAKVDAPDPVLAGSNITYTITATNNGPSDAAAFTLADTTPANTTFVAVTPPVGFACTAPAVGGTGAINCSGGNIVATNSAVFTITVNVNPATPNATIITNTATGASATTDPNPADNSATTTTTVSTVVLSADLGVTKTDSPDPVTAGANITYTINVTNAGPDPASNFTLSDTLPANTTFVSLTSAAGYACTTPAVGGTGAVTCTNASVAASANDTFTLVVQVGAGTPNATTISNTATVGSTTTDPSAANNSATATTTVATNADLAVTKTDAPDPVVVGSNITYTIQLTNGGPSDAASVSLTDTTPANTTFVSLTSAAGYTCTTPAVGGTGPITCNNPTVLAGANDSFTLVVQVGAAVVAGTTITNTATVTSTTPDANPANNSATATTATSAAATSADLSLTKTASPNPVAAGANITYTITLQNAGPSAATTVQLSDAVPANTTFVSTTAPAGYTVTAPAVGGTGTVTFTNPSVANAANDVFTIVVQVGAGVAGGTIISNTATVTSATADANPANNSATATTTTTAVATSADLSVTKTGAPNPVAANANITYTITVQNAGPSAASTVQLSDTVPANTTFVSLTSAAGYTCTTPAVGGTGPVTCTNPSVANGASGVFTLVVKVNAGAGGLTITNTATVSSATADANATNNSATATTTVSATVGTNVPALSPLGLMLLAMSLAAAGWFISKR